ncbi:mitochondrial chaperone bcs1 [Coprinopsis cinerea AmutBmut pab1-1]|nr:mitochondrial chaperone bcs1 [Coprinopsis cinerea AmutBmut pab1-1]
MAAPLDVAQQVFALLNGGALGSQQHVACVNNTLNGTATSFVPPTSAALPTSFDIHSILTFIFSFSALREWVKLAAIGAVLETFRRFVFHFYYKIWDAFFITVLFEDDDVAYGMSLSIYLL